MSTKLSILMSRKKLYLLVLVALTVIAPYILPSYALHIVILFYIWATIAQAWNLLGGYIKEVSFGHAAFFGIGAYAAALLTLKPKYWEAGLKIMFRGIVPPQMFILTIIAAGIAAAFFALIIGYPLLLLKGPYFTIATLGLTTILRVIVLDKSEWTYGAGGIVLPTGAFDVSVHYYTSLILFAVAMFVIYRMVTGKFGYASRAIGDDEISASAFGINVMKFKLIALVVSAFFTGMAGGCWAHFIYYIHPYNTFVDTISLEAVVMCVLGGIGTLTGPLIGTFLLIALREALAGFLYVHLLILAIILIVCCIAMPGGVSAFIKRKLKVSWL